MARNQYAQVNIQTEVESATPHRLIQMLMQSFLDYLERAKMAMERKEVALKGESLGKALSILALLRASLNHETGKDLSEKLEQLYDYMENILLEANIKNKPELIEESFKLMSTIKEGWDGISE